MSWSYFWGEVTLTEKNVEQLIYQMNPSLDKDKRILLYARVQRLGITSDVAKKSFGYTDSPLSHKLESMGFNADIYLKLAQHLIQRIEEPEHPNLCNKGFVFKWNYIDKNYDYDDSHLEKLDVQPNLN